eukprot:1151989-Pelagomonas_calceolata.AAC.2
MERKDPVDVSTVQKPQTQILGSEEWSQGGAIPGWPTTLQNFLENVYEIVMYCWDFELIPVDWRPKGPVHTTARLGSKTIFWDFSNPSSSCCEAYAHVQ